MAAPELYAPRRSERAGATESSDHGGPQRRRGIVYRALTSAVALAVVGGFGYFAWTAYTGESASREPDGALALIVSPSEPLKTAPADPGGLAVAGGGYAIFNQMNGERPVVSPGEEQVLPQPETPVVDLMPDLFDAPAPIPADLTDALDSQSGAAAASLAVDVVPAAARAGVSVPPVLLEPMQPLPALDEQYLTPRPVAQASGSAPVADIAAGPAVAEPSADGEMTAQQPIAARVGATVQLAAMRSRELAEQEWARLRRLMPDLLGDRTLIIRESASGDRVFYRVSVAADGAIAAAALCSEIKNRELDCIVHN